MAVTVRGHIYNKGNVETWAAIKDSLGIFCHAPVQKFVGREIGKGNSIEITRSQAATAADAIFFVNAHLLCFGIKGESVVSTFLQAYLTTSAFGFVNLSFAAEVLLGLTGAGTAAHANIFDCPTKTGHLVPFEMRQADKHVCIHDGTSDLSSLYIFASDHRHFNIVGAF